MGFKQVHEVLESAMPGHLKMVAIVYAECADIDTGVCWPSYNTVARRASISRRQAIRNTAELEEAGALTRIGTQPGPNGDLIMRRVNCDLLGSLWTSLDEETGDNMSLVSPTSPVTPTAGTSDTHDTSLVSPMSPESSYNHQEQSPCASEPKIDLMAGFDTWWNVYPKKVGKKLVATKWKSRKLHKIADVLVEDVHRRLKEDDLWKRGFAPNPLTYINQDRWEDEIARPSTTSAPPQQIRIPRDDIALLRMAQANKIPTQGRPRFQIEADLRRALSLEEYR